MGRHKKGGEILTVRVARGIVQKMRIHCIKTKQGYGEFAGKAIEEKLARGKK